MSSPERRPVDGRQLRWESHKEERRRSIIDAALAVIQTHAPGETIHVQQIADQAGLNRSALHRLFRDRDDLDLAIQTEICNRARDVVFAAVTLELEPRAVVHRIVGQFVRWVIAHPAWIRFVERSIRTDAESPLDEALKAVSAQFESLIAGVASVLGGELTGPDRKVFDAWVSGLVRGGLASVQRWTAQGKASRPEPIVNLVSDMIWFQIDGLATSRGIPIPEGPIDAVVDQLFADD